MARAYVSIGSNIRPTENIRSCLAWARERFGAVIVSPVYVNPAQGFAGADFHNLVIGFDTAETPLEVAQALRAIEHAHGRDRSAARFSSRTLDLDLLLYGDAVLDAPGLHLPRRDITQYAFVLRPLADIAGAVRHPLLGKSYAELWAEFDQSAVELRPMVIDEAGAGHERK